MLVVAKLDPFTLSAVSFCCFRNGGKVPAAALSYPF